MSPNSYSRIHNESTTDNALKDPSSHDDTSQSAPVAPMGPHELSPTIPGLSFIGSPEQIGSPEPLDMTEDVRESDAMVVEQSFATAALDSMESGSQDGSKKRRRSEDGDDELEESPEKKVRFEEESQS
ncbi:hypothetical protein CIB48_g11734 [Xylaria polymorpha]|nr:hypothetical protein CIB48_g11734 [Xylaria polymorpha]